MSAVYIKPHIIKRIVSCIVLYCIVLHIFTHSMHCVLLTEVSKVQSAASGINAEEAARGINSEEVILTGWSKHSHVIEERTIIFLIINLSYIHIFTSLCVYLSERRLYSFTPFV